MELYEWYRDVLLPTWRPPAPKPATAPKKPAPERRRAHVRVRLGRVGAVPANRKRTRRSRR
jgi:hypothetical protein